MNLSLDHQIDKIRNNFQQTLPNHLVTSLVLLQEELNIIYVSPAAEALLVKSNKRLYLQQYKDVFITNSITEQHLKKLLETGQEFNDSDVALSFIDRPDITVEMTASSILFLERPHILLEFKQIDQQKQINAEAFQQQQWESARDLIRGLAHEIKNPLGGLRGAAQLLNNEITEEQQEYTAMIIEQADRLTTLVDRLLGPNQLPKMETKNIHTVLEKVNQLLRFNNPKNITIKRDYDPSIPDIVFDEDKLHQAILNIVNNAVHAVSSDNTILMKTRIASNQTIHGKRIKLGILISIIDDGPGIPSHIQDTLFYPMVSGRKDGTGLGLSICQTLIHQHNGKIWCKSRPGQTAFNILLPISEE